MKKISTGQDSTLKTYREIALCLSINGEQSRAVKFFDERIKEAPNGENEEVIADERQMMYIIGQMLVNELEDVRNGHK